MTAKLRKPMLGPSRTSTQKPVLTPRACPDANANITPTNARMTHHPRLNNHGQPVAIHSPSQATPLPTWQDPAAMARVVPDGSKSQALYNNQWLELDYTNAKEERKQHRVMALHRIHSAQASTLTFERPDFDLARYDADDGCHITTTVVQTLLLDRWLLGFGGQIRNIRKTAVTA